MNNAVKVLANGLQRIHEAAVNGQSDWANERRAAIAAGDVARVGHLDQELKAGILEKLKQLHAA